MKKNTATTVGMIIVVVLVWFFPKTTLFLLGIIIASLILVVGFITLAPLFADKLITTPKSPKHIWGLPLFTKLENGREKVIVDAGGNIRRFIINKNGTGFKGILPGDDPDEQWNNVPSDNFSNARNAWEKWIEDTTGLIYVGPYPWRQVPFYEIHIAKVLTEDGVRKLVRKPPELSDHVRVREFNWGAQVEVVLQGFYRITILFSFRLECVNAKKMLFNVDQWDESFADAVTGRAVDVIQSMSPEELMNTDSATESFITAQITQINDAVNPKIEKNWGLKIIQTQISKFGYESLSAEEKSSLTIKEVTKRRMEARAIEYDTEAEGQENVLTKRAGVIEKFGQAGVAASRDEMLETAAEEGNQTIVTGLGSSSGSNNEELERLLKAYLARQNKK